MKAETLQQVAEVQGLYGPFTFPEVLLQQIWRRGEFQQTAIRTTEGKALDVLHPGRWNRLGGPDFRSARLRLDGVELVGMSNCTCMRRIGRRMGTRAIRRMMP